VAEIWGIFWETKAGSRMSFRKLHAEGQRALRKLFINTASSAPLRAKFLFYAYRLISQLQLSYKRLQQHYNK
jgi:hypothetical protein